MPGGTHEIKTRFKLEGEQEYRRAMKESADAIKVLASEQKLAKAEFEQTGDAQQYAADSARILREEIEHQKSAVNAAESALKELAANGVAENSKQVQTWQKKLNEAKTTLVQMETRLDGVERELNESGTAYKGNESKIKSLETAMKNLDAREKLAEAQYRETGDAQQYAADKAQILREKIDLQKQIVAQCEEAIKSMTENGVDPNSAEMVEWKTKLANAKTTLSQLETQLDKTEKELEDQTGDLGTAKKAVTDAETAIKDLNAREKLAEAQFKATGDAETYLKDKTELARAKLAEQEKIVASCEAAIKSMTDNGVDPSSEEMVEWKTKLANAKTTLSQMETQLNNTESELNDQTSGLNSAKKAVSDAESAIKDLNAREKLAEAQFKATGNSEQLLADKTQILKEKIDAQKTVVENCEKAIKALTDKGVEPNAKEMVEWKTKLANAKTTLSGLETRLDNVGEEVKEETTEFKNAEGGADNLKASLDKVAEGVDFSNTISGIDRITGAIESVVKKAAQAAKAIFELQMEAGDWADTILTESTKMQIDPETYQSWVYASRTIDTSVSDISTGMQKIESSLEGATTDTLAGFAKLGVATRDMTGKQLSYQQVFWNAIDSLHAMTDEQKRADAATQLFGKSWKNLQPLIEAGSKEYFRVAEEGKKVAVVSNDNVAALGQMDDAYEELSARLEKTKFDTLAALAPTFKEIAEGLSEAVTSLDEFIQSEAGRQALTELGEAIKGIIGAFTGENGGDTFKGIVDAAKQAVVGFTNAMKWISENGETVKNIIFGMGVAWAGLKATSSILTFMQLLKDTPLAKLTTLFSGGGAGAAQAAAGAAASGAAQTGGAVASAGAAAGGIGSVLAGGAVLYGGYKAFEWAKERRTNGDQAALVDTAEHVEAATNGSKLLKEKFEEFVKAQAEQDAAMTAWAAGDMTDEEFETVIEKANEASKALQEMEGWEEVLDAYRTWRDANSIADWILPENWETLGSDAMAGLESGITSGLGNVETAGAQAGDTLTNAAKAALDEHSPSRVFHTIGENVSVGLANGIYARASEAIRAAQWLADQIRSTVQQALQIHSPSRVFEQMGEYTGMGFAEGLERSAAAVSRAAGNMVRATVQAPVRAVPLSPAVYASPVAAARQGASAGAGNVHVTLMLDEEVLGDVMAPLVNEKIGAKINATRR